jgi:hypothetical protein
MCKFFLTFFCTFIWGQLRFEFNKYKNNWFFARPACFLEIYKLFHCHLLVNKINFTLPPSLPPKWTCPSAVEYLRNRCTVFAVEHWFNLYKHHWSNGQRSLFCPNIKVTGSIRCNALRLCTVLYLYYFVTLYCFATYSSVTYRSVTNRSVTYHFLMYR